MAIRGRCRQGSNIKEKPERAYQNLLRQGKIEEEIRHFVCFIGLCKSNGTGSHIGGWSCGGTKSII